MFMTYPLVAGLAFGIWDSTRDSAIASHQLTTTGVVTAYEPENHNQCRYIFSVQGKSFEGHDSAPHHPQPLGEVVNVFYDSTNPSASGLEDYSKRGKREGGLIPLCVFGILLIPAIILYNKIVNANRLRDAF